MLFNLLNGYYSSFHVEVKVNTKLLKDSDSLLCSFCYCQAQAQVVVINCRHAAIMQVSRYHAAISRHQAGRCEDGRKNSEKLRRMAELNVLPSPCISSSRPGFRRIQGTIIMI